MSAPDFERQNISLRTHLSDRPNTRALHNGSVTSPLLTLDICGPTKNVSRGFPLLLRDNAFDFSELSLMTYLQARAAGLPYVLLPAVVFARFQHNTLWYRTELGPLAPADLAGRRVGIRSHSVTTVIWARGILQADYGLDPDTVTWVVNEPSHLPGFVEPDNVVYNDLKGRTLQQSLVDGDVDAAILNGPARDEPRLSPLLPDADAAARSWFERNGTISINHMAVVSTELSARRPDLVREVYRMLKEARDLAPVQHLGADATAFGIEANRKGMALAIEYALRQRIIPRRLSVEELFDETTYALA